MPTRGKSKNRGGKNKEENVGAETEAIGSTKEPEAAFASVLSATDWRTMLDEEDTELFIAELVDEWIEHAVDVWYDRYLDRATIPYIWEWYKSNLLELIRLDRLPPESVEDPLTDPSWMPDPEPVPTPIDAWAPAAVPFITTEQLEEQHKRSMVVSSKSPLQFETVQPLEPLVSDSTIRDQLSSALSLNKTAPPRVEKDLETCMDDYSSSDLSIVTAADSCDWWKWAQAKRLDKQPTYETGSLEEAARRVLSGETESLSGDEEQEAEYRKYINWMHMTPSKEENTEELDESGAVSQPDSASLTGCQATDEAETKEINTSQQSVLKVKESVYSPTPSTIISECAECFKSDEEVKMLSSARDSCASIPELPALKKLRALRLSRCPGLLVPSDSSTDTRLPAIDTSKTTAKGGETLTQRGPAKKGKHRSSRRVAHGGDPGHYEQVDIDCEVVALQRLDAKKTAYRSVMKGSKKEPKH